MVYDSVCGQSLMFGGIDNNAPPTNPYGDTWQFRGSCVGAGQGNSGAARLHVNCSGWGLCTGPFSASVASSGGSLTLSWFGPANAPFLLFAGPQNVANQNLGCIGTVDVGTPPLYQDLFLLMDGTQNPAFSLGPNGTATQTFTLPILPPATQLGNIQGAILQPTGAPCFVVLTAAFFISVY